MYSTTSFLLAALSGAMTAQVPVFYGADQLYELKKVINHKTPIAIVTNQTGKTSSGERTIDALLRQKYSLKKIFVPEHGLDGQTLAEKKIDDSHCVKTKLPVISLYKGGGNPWGRFSDEVHDVDAILIDLQDAGMRHYTYVSTMYRVLEAAAKINKMVIILDRPNPLGGLVDGPLVEPGLISFIGIAPIPLRHGMTMAELALYFNKHILEKPANLHVIPLAHYNRKGVEGSLLAPLSPNIASLHSLLGYSFLGLLGEISPFNVGVGTRSAFQCIMLPESLNISQKDWVALSLGLEHKFGIKSTAFGYYDEAKRKRFAGLRLRISDINKLPTVEPLLYVLDFFQNKNVLITFSAFFDKAAGSPCVRGCAQGILSKQELAQKVHGQLKDFMAQAKDCLLYHPGPHLA